MGRAMSWSAYDFVRTTSAEKACRWGREFRGMDATPLRDERSQIPYDILRNIEEHGILL